MVTFPANPLSLITDVKQWSRKDYERALRGLGFSRRKAEGLAGNGWAAMGRRQAAPRNGAGSEPEDSPAETAEFIQRINELTGLFK